MTAPFDPQAFVADLDALRRRVRARLSPDDLAHRNKISRWGRLCSLVGYGTSWIAPNPISALLISQGRLTRWAMIAHHTSHRGYDQVPGAKPHQTSRRFAQGWRRAIDWLDWIDPKAWHHEHDFLHHYHLGETDKDPDLLEENVDWLRDSDLPKAVKLAIMGFFMATWKWSYYAPNTLRVLLDEDLDRAAMFTHPELWRRCLLPYAIVHFGLIPALFLPLGPFAVGNVLANSLLGELFTNLHAFAVIVTNHAGADLSRFDGPLDNKAEFYRRQILGSTNFRTGSDLNDFLHGWLNYQIEHHLFPDLPMRQYQLIQPEVQALCEKHGLPYIQEDVLTRLGKTLKVALGEASMLREATA